MRRTRGNPWVGAGRSAICPSWEAGGVARLSMRHLHSPISMCLLALPARLNRIAGVRRVVWIRTGISSIPASSSIVKRVGARTIPSSKNLIWWRTQESGPVRKLVISKCVERAHCSVTVDLTPSLMCSRARVQIEDVDAESNKPRPPPAPFAPPLPPASPPGSPAPLECVACEDCDFEPSRKCNASGTTGPELTCRVSGDPHFETWVRHAASHWSYSARAQHALSGGHASSSASHWRCHFSASATA